MPSGTHWTLNPKKWFGSNSNASKGNTLPRLQHRGTVSTTTTNSSLPRFLPGPNQIPIVPVSVSTELYQEKRYISMASNATPIRQFQLPAFSARREQGTALYPSSAGIWNHQSICLPKRTEPTIRKQRRRGAEDLSIDTTTRWNVPQTPKRIYNLPQHDHTIEKKAQNGPSNISRQCLIDYPRQSFNPTEEFSSTLSSASSTSSLMEERDYTSTSGIYTDERQFIDSKETLEIRSITSMGDSHTTFQKIHNRPLIHRFRRPLSVLENDDEQRRRESSIQQAHRSCSAEDVLQSTPTNRSRALTEIDEENAEKPITIHRASNMTLEKVGFVRIGNDSYRLTVDKSEELYHRRKHSIDSLVQYSDPEENDGDDEEDEALPAAHDEESYAELPRTSSTEQLNNLIQEDLRHLLDQCFRPMINSIGKTRPTKTQQLRLKRNTHDSTPLRAEDIAEKLYSSVNYPIYSQFQRCC